MKKVTIIKSVKSAIFLTGMLLPLSFASSQQDLSGKLKGKILLEVENHGEAWYVYPYNQKRYFLGRPQDAFQVMKNLGQGITDQSLAQVPIGIIETNNNDTDQDGLNDAMEEAIGSDIYDKDSDGDGYSDLQEIKNNYNPNGKGKMPLDQNFVQKNLGAIFLQIEKNGEAWYLDPETQKRYFLGRPYDAWQIMKKLGLGITTQNLEQIEKKSLPLIQDKDKEDYENKHSNSSTTCSSCYSLKPEEVLNSAAGAINNGNTEEAQKYFVSDMHQSIKYSIDFMNEDGRSFLANLMRGAQKESSSDSTAVFNSNFFSDWMGRKVDVTFKLEKKSDKWLIKSFYN